MEARRYRQWFASEGAFYRVLLVVSGITAVLKGLHMPYAWPATQAQIDYRYGFLRRGLFGEVCRQLHLPIWRYGVFSATSFALLILFFILLARCVRRSGLDAAGLGAFSALIASSYCITLLVNVVGFYDILMAALVLAVFLIRRPGLQLACAALAGIVGVLVHELYAIAFLPASLMGAVCWASQDARRRMGRWAGVAAVALVPWLIVFVIAHNAEMTVAQDEALKAAIRARVNFEPYDHMLEVLTFSSRDNVQLMLNIMRSGSWWVEEVLGAIAFLPAAAFFLAIAWRLAAGRGRLVKAWLVMATLAPLLLNFAGFDRYRWLAMVTLDAFLCAIALAFANQHARQAAPVFSIAWRRAAVLLLVLNVATEVGFFEGRARNFPFRDYWADYRESGEAHRPWLAPPGILPKRTP